MMEKHFKVIDGHLDSPETKPIQFQTEKIKTIILDDSKDGRWARNKYIHDVKNSVKRISLACDLLQSEGSGQTPLQGEIIGALRETHDELKEVADLFREIFAGEV